MDTYEHPFSDEVRETEVGIGQAMDMKVNNLNFNSNTMGSYMSNKQEPNETMTPDRVIKKGPPKKMKTASMSNSNLLSP